MVICDKDISERYKTKGSEFIGYLFYVADKIEFRKHLEIIKENHPAATHHCTAYRIGIDRPQEYYNDDGEPSGTAGRPICNQLRSFELTNSGVVVVRYFGGTKLGKAGLIDAYSHTTKLCIHSTLLKPVSPAIRYKLTYPYDKQSAIKQLCNRFNFTEHNANYTAKITKEIVCPKKQTADFEKELARLQHFGIIAETLGATFTVIHT